jgi:hypothetical protein
MPPSRYTPALDSAKACTDEATPERTRKVPKRVRANVVAASTRLKTRSVPRRSCNAAPWRYAVAVSQGRRLTFSTGSHAQ